MSKKIILLGYMGSGKSIVGQKLAEKMQFPFYDLDKAIQEQEQMSISEIFSRKGAIYFRTQEARYVRDWVESNVRGVMSLGGGTPCYGSTMEYLLQQPDVITIYLSATLQTLTDRLMPQREQRPLLQNLSSEAALSDYICKHLFERTYYYHQAHLTIATDFKNPDEIAIEIYNYLYNT